MSRNRQAIEPLPNPSVRQIGNTRFWEMMEVYRLFLPPPWQDIEMVLPFKWIYDRATIPELVPAWIVSKDDLGCLPPAPHDASYSKRGIFEIPTTTPTAPYLVQNGFIIAHRFTRAETDRIFHTLLLIQRVPSWRAKAAFWAVRWFNKEWD